jgi:integrase
MAIHKLSAARIAKLTKNGMYGDGGNLWLEVTGSGAGKSWLFRWTDRISGRGRYIGLGPLHTVSLDRARELALANRLLLLEGKDPKEERDGRRLDDQIARGLVKTVSQVADEYFEVRITRKSAGYRTNAAWQLRKYVHTTIGSMPIQKVDRNTLLNKTGLAELWIQKNTTAKLVHMHLNGMFKLAIARGYYREENPAAWAQLRYVLPAPADVHKTEHNESLPYKDVGRFLERVRAYRDRRFAIENHRPTISFWLEFVVLTGVRVSEVRLAQWKEFDLEQNIWSVPPGHRKTGHLNGKVRPIPITKPMRAVLEEMQKRRTNSSPDALAFPGPNSRTPAGQTRMATFLSRDFRWETKITAHGFRSTLRDWCRAWRFPDVLWSIQVDHVLGDRTSQAYGHDPLIEERRDMMEKWGEYCSRPAPEPQNGDVVVNLADKRRA